MDVAATQYLLGVRPEIDGLVIDPVMRSEWSRYTIIRRYRGCLLRILVHNPQHIEHGVAQLTVDGPVISPAMLADKASAQVEVVLGDR